jgi:hypothetical protein
MLEPVGWSFYASDQWTGHSIPKSRSIVVEGRYVLHRACHWIEYKRMAWSRYVACIGKMRNAYKILVWKPVRKYVFGDVCLYWTRTRTSASKSNIYRLTYASRKVEIELLVRLFRSGRLRVWISAWRTIVLTEISHSFLRSLDKLNMSLTAYLFTLYSTLVIKQNIYVLSLFLILFHNHNFVCHYQWFCHERSYVINSYLGF